MAENIRYIHPSDQLQYVADFQDILPTADGSLKDIDAGSAITAVDSGGDDANGVLFDKTRTGKTLMVTLKNCDEGEEYQVTFLAQGVTSLQRFTKVVAFRCRKGMTGEF